MFSGLVLLLCDPFPSDFCITLLHLSLWSSYLPLSTYFHVLITTSYSVFLFTWPNHTSLIFSLALIYSVLIFSILLKTGNIEFGVV